ncbi:MAG: Cl- channel voltage-gated family protein [Desulfobacterales bacterium SG8_35]|nr:MAG: Cl- channel voltage-gated family protein [Desulfobacterales bacterium SG8_35]
MNATGVRKYLLPGENTRMVFIASCIGVMAGLANICFRTVLEFVHHMIFVPGYAIASQGGWYILLLPLVPISGMLLLIPLAILFPGEIYGYGFTKFLRKVNIRGGSMKFRKNILKIISCSLTIGTGNSAGVEGPIAQVGGALGSLVGKIFRISADRMKVYTAAGCAGGVAAMFNAPIAGVFFAAEIVLLGTYEIASFSVLVISSAMATVVSRSYYGENPAFPIPEFHLVNPLAEIPLYMVLGLLMGVIAVLHIYVFYKVRDRFAALKINEHIKPVMGAFIIGILGMFFPQVMGDGYHYIKEVLAGNSVLWLMALLIFLKIFATAVTLGAGGSGGVFAPALFIGAVIGGAYGSVVHHLFPTATASSGAYAAVGLGAFLAATTHAPLTAIFLLFEMTGDYLIIIPIMLASIIGTVVAARFNEDSIDTVDFTREGIDIHEGRETAIMKSIKVGRIITEDVDLISENANADQLLQIFSMAKDSFYFPVIDETGKMTGVVSLQDVKTVLHDEELRRHATVGSVCARNPVFLTPDDNLYTAMTLFDGRGFDEIPVVESAEEKWVVGMLKRRDVIAAYNHEVLKKGISERTASIKLT